MANHLDLEEQEQLDQLKHFWKRYGDLITWVLIIALGAVAAWNAYQYYQRNQAAQSSALFDEVERAATGGDMARLDRSLADIKDKFGGTSFAQQAALLAAKTYTDKGKTEEAKAALSWVAGKSSDEGYQAIARLRLVGILAEAKAYDEALKQLGESFPKEFEPLVADRKGDIYLLQGNRAAAKTEFEKAYAGFDARAEYRRMVEVKLNSLGVEAKAPAADGKEGKK